MTTDVRGFGGPGGSGRGFATLMVAASNASVESKANADFICPGVHDEITIGSAVAALPSMGGELSFSEGAFNFGALLTPGAGKPVWWRGRGAFGQNTGSGTWFTGAGTEILRLAGDTIFSEIVISNAKMTLNGANAGYAIRNARFVAPAGSDGLSYIAQPARLSVLDTLFTGATAAAATNAQYLHVAGTAGSILRIGFCQFLVVGGGDIAIHLENANGANIGQCDFNDTTGFAPGDGILIDGTSSNNFVHDAKFNFLGGVGTAFPNCVNVSGAAAVANWITNNDFHGAYSGAGLLDTGTGTVTAAGNRP